MLTPFDAACLIRFDLRRRETHSYTNNRQENNLRVGNHGQVRDFAELFKNRCNNKGPGAPQDRILWTVKL